MRRGASEDDILRAEARIGRPLPGEVRTAYRVHDGGALLDVARGEMLSLAQATEERAMMNDIGWGRGPELPNDGQSVGPVKPLWWSEGWLPFVGTAGGTMLCLDLDPPPGGALGQVVEYWKDGPERTVRFVSITAWLEHWADRLESDALYYDEDLDELVEAVGEAARSADPPPLGDRLLRDLVDAGALAASPTDTLASAVEAILARSRGPKARARSLERLFLGSDEVDDVFWDTERLALFLEAW